MPRGETPYFQDPDYSAEKFDEFLQKTFSTSKPLVSGIKRPDYLAKPEVPERIKAHCKNVKLIVTLRQPVERAIAAYYHYMMNGFLPILPIEVGMKKIISGESHDRYPRGREILEYGLYHKHLTRYLNHFEESKLLITFLDDIKKDPLSVAHNLYEFLGVDPLFLPHQAIKTRPQKVIYSIDALRYIQFKNKINFVYSADRLRMHPRYPTALGKLLLVASNATARIIARKYNNSPNRAAPENIRNTLYSFYSDDIAQLALLTKKDLSDWLPSI